MKKPISFGIVGTNFISDKFSEAAFSVKDASLSAVYSRSSEKGNTFAKRHGIPTVYTSYEDMLADKDIDAVYIASPTFLHKDMTVSALKAGKHCLTEKMIALDYSEFCEMKNCARDCGLVLLEAMRSDYDEAFRLVENHLEKLSGIKDVCFEFCQYSSRYDAFKRGIVENAFNPKIKNSALSDIGIYPLHLAVRLFGLPCRVKANSRFLENGFEAEGTVSLIYNDKCVNIRYSKIEEGENVSRIAAENGYIEFGKINAPQKLSILIDGKEYAKEYRPMKNNMAAEIQAFCDTVRGKADNSRFLAVTEDTMKLVDMIYSIANISF